MKDSSFGPNTCIKCNRGTLMPHTDAMDKANGLKPERKCNECGKEYPAYPLTWKQEGYGGLRPKNITLYLESLIRDTIPVHGQYTVQRVLTVLGLKRSLVYDVYKGIRKETGAYHVVKSPEPQPVPIPDVLTWTKTETITQPWRIDKMNGLMPDLEQVIVIQWTGRIVSTEVRVKT